MEPWEIEPVRKLTYHIETLVDEFLAEGHSPALLQIVLTDILATDLIARQEGIMEMLGGRYEDEEPSDDLYK